jgi:hypothetical protein
MEAVRGAASSPAVARLLGIELHGNGLGVCPFHDDKEPSFQAFEGGGWKCYAGCGVGGDGLSLWFRSRGSHRREDIEALGLALGCGVAPSKGSNGKAQAATTDPAVVKRGRKAGDLSAMPWDASEQPPADLHHHHGTPSHSWRILDADGRLFAVHYRYELPNRKRFAWWRKGAWNLGGVKVAVAPLYGAELLGGWGQGAAVIVTEGEKAADALRARGLHAVATVCGSGTTPAPAVLTVLSGHSGPLILWPDNDISGKGRAHMEGLRAVLPAGLDVRTFAPRNLPDKGDAYEWTAARAAPEASADELLREILAEAIKHGPTVAPAAAIDGDQGDAGATPRQLIFQDLDAFSREEEDSPVALVGTAESCALPAGGMLLLYGDGGAGKTTLSLDFIAHAASGTAWLGLPIARPLKILVIENEGPRPHFRGKLRKKVDGWEGRPFAGNVRVLRDPWAGLTFLDDAQREALAREIEAFEADVVVAGPLATLGAAGAGTPDDVTAFDDLIKDLRRRSRKDPALILVHHENKAGAISGAWVRVPDSLVHLETEKNGRSRITWRKARWSSELHGTMANLVWEGGDGYRLEDAPAVVDYGAKVLEALAGGEWLTRNTIKAAAAIGVDSAEKALQQLKQAGAVEYRLGGPGVPPNSHCYRLAGPCLDLSGKAKQGEQRTFSGVSLAGACSPCPSPVGGQGESKQGPPRSPTLAFAEDPTKQGEDFQESLAI